MAKARGQNAEPRHVPLYSLRHKLLTLAKARVLLTNDDGIQSPGIRILEKVLATRVGEVWTVAPESEQSAAGHSLTLRRPLRMYKLGPRRFAVNGTPTDCVLLAAREIMRATPPDLVISGINRGGNTADDITYSGTIAAAMEATLLGIPAIALSQVCDDRHKIKWATAEHWLPDVLKRILRVRWPLNVFINVNFPDLIARSVKGIAVVPQAQCEGKGGDPVRGVDPRGEPYWWIGGTREDQPIPPGTDLDAVERGSIAVTPLTLDLTHGPTLKALRRAIP
ncbi:MAG: 5'/3'-nucleotidase SurE [Rhodospirillales bacterium]|nr:5'/3'-nucleotidase SurE [Rhodospirillales bacterium]MSP81136.1 5'/3'-nucleotidase SurE [Rhodospirillales bacterium]